MTPTMIASPESNATLTDDCYSSRYSNISKARELTLTDSEERYPRVDFVTRFNQVEVHAEHLGEGDLEVLEWAVGNLAKYFFLEPDWDSYSGTSLSIIAARRGTIFFLMLGRKGVPLELIRRFRILPVSDGGLQLEYSQGDTDLEITFHPSGESDFCIEASGHEFEGDLDDDAIERLSRTLAA